MVEWSCNNSNFMLNYTDYGQEMYTELNVYSKTKTKTSR